MNMKTLTPLFLALAAGPAFADWNVQYTFDGPDLPEGIFSEVLLEGGTEFSDIQNGMLRLNHGEPGPDTVNSNLWVMLPFDVDLKAASEAANGPVTVYFQMMHPEINGEKAIVDIAWGLSNIDEDTILDTRYNAFSAMMRIEPANLNWELRDGGSYTTIAPLEAGEVYEVWMVVDYTLNFMEVYIKGGQYTEQTNIGLVAFRNNPTAEQTVDKMAFGVSSGTIAAPKGVDYMLFDNVAIDETGQNLTSPAGGWEVKYTFDGPDLPEGIFSEVLLEGGTEFSDIQNGMLRLNHGEPGPDTVNSNLWVMLPLGTDLKAASMTAEGPVTVFFEMVHPEINGEKAIVDIAWGLSNIDEDTILDTRYNAFSAMMRIEPANLNWELRDGGSYTTIAPLEAGQTYKVWMVVDYTLNFMEVYIQGGQYTNQTNIGLVAFRNNPTEDQTVDKMAFGVSSGTIAAPKGVDYMLFDNVAVNTSGQDLTDPTAGTGGMKWAGYDVNGDGDCFTGDWLGWVNVDFAPWIYSYSLQQWLFIDESKVGPGGAWIYVFNF